MRGSNLWAILFSVLLGCVAAAGQSDPTPTGPPRINPNTGTDNSDADFQKRVADMYNLERKLGALPGTGKATPAEPKLSSEQRERVMKLRRVAAPDVEKYGGLLKQEHTGIFKLFPDLGCVSKQVVKVSAECERFVPLSSHFTFRTNSYSNDIYHDLRFKDGYVSGNSFFSQGVFTTIGDEPVENVGLTHPALKFLTSFVADVDAKSAAAHASEFQTGVDSGSYRYADRAEVRENVTYAMRSIAYRLENSLRPMSEETTTNEMMFLSLPYDKRLDVIVVFRILGRDENGGITIVWKELARSNAAKIKFGKNEALKDFRPAQK